MKNLIITLFIACGLAQLPGCKKYINIVPDDVATINNAFTLRQEAIKYLFTCYSYLPNDGSYNNNPAFGAGDEVWQSPYFQNTSQDPIHIAMGQQNSNGPLMSIWGNMFNALRDCNIFLDNIDHVVDLEPYEKTRWVAEVTFLKAYYHWLLLRQYGPIPIVEKNLPISAGIDEMKIKRVTVDSAVNYICRLLDTAASRLPLTIADQSSELGRITRPIALSIKARVLVTAASPLFNGNTDYGSFKALDGKPFFNPTSQPAKWQRAADACLAAIQACNTAGVKLYKFSNSLITLPDVLNTEMSIRNAICQKWNSETIWGNPNSRPSAWDGNGATSMQTLCIPRLDPSRLANQVPQAQLAPTMKMVELFYSMHGVPINEDITYNYADRYSLRTAVDSENYYLQSGYQTATINFDREPRFYADMAFDGSQYFMANQMWGIQAKMGQSQSQKNTSGYSITGYFTKKLVNWNYVIQDGQSVTTDDYPWPEMRLADLYLLYAEALNEADGPSSDIYQYLNLIRARAGLPAVQDAWTQYSNNPSKFQTQSGLRDIIRQERGIELAFEGSRFWDLLRWKTAITEWNKQVVGWDVTQADPNFYYRRKILYTQIFQPRQYLWPLAVQDVTINPNILQNPGW
ncbi:RagB/SusD family nutrient uptake outer membrane protein [Flavitalea sp. BT771]|uniref:RagB/SusD family nutrient uptake outer membrane protein n=1 Tax=Flavitalea sp. BT771 TaxID=3063329 RepID=UPI0026E26EFD|nr:RagB/SusD family nutrient uptake outer membrane protein [Flavitalea sp. BT771]MDO6435685.1 RagB/SusD family nutrient uptake outer membrane protein [Flavitalea sp. BT771]MDV6224586.1 RagB/SusD family nutrient uptake outer membrane protein [Flavitalea sp. BT771]